jgi:type VI secretion system protein ImpM
VPRKVLTDPFPQPATDDERPVVGFFGKLPSTGDFVSRGLPDAFRRNWDAWITRHVAPHQRAAQPIPSSGLRFRLVSGGRTAAGMILPSSDSAGRLFPLSVVIIADGGLAQTQIDAWCDAMLQLSIDQHSMTPDDFWQSLDGLPAPETTELVESPMLLWIPSHPAITTNSDDAGEAIQLLLALP